MQNLRTVLLFVLGLAGLATASSLFTGQVEVNITELPTATPLVRNTPPAEPTEAAQTDCLPTARGSGYGYQPEAPFTTTLAPPELKGERMIISGTVYAADCLTPLPGALVEVWQNDASPSQPTEHSLLRARMRTDANGHYKFTTIGPGPNRAWPAHIHYRVTYPDGHNATTTAVFFEDAPAWTSASATNSGLIVSLVESEDPEDTKLYGLFNIVIPVEAPIETTKPDCLATPHSTGVQDYVVEVPFTTNLAPAKLKGTRLIVSGMVYASDHRTPLPDVLLEVWQADAEGHYDHTPPFTLRARMRTDASGGYEFTTIKPGPVKVGCEFLPAHINYLVSYSDYRPLYVAQFFADDPYLAEYLPLRPAVISTLVEQRSHGEPVLRAIFDIVLPDLPLTSTATPVDGP